MTITFPCDCEAEEHELEISAEGGHPGQGNRVGLYAPSVGDVLPCGRVLNAKDIEDVAQRAYERTLPDEDYWGEVDRAEIRSLDEPCDD